MQRERDKRIQTFSDRVVLLHGNVFFFFFGMLALTISREGEGEKEREKRGLWAYQDLFSTHAQDMLPAHLADSPRCYRRFCE